MANQNPTSPAGVRSDEAPVAQALAEIIELATRLRRDLVLAISTMDALLAEAGEARSAMSGGNVMASVEQTTFSSERVEELREFAATEVEAAGEIGMALSQNEYEEAQEAAAIASDAIAALNLLGWGDEEPHEVILHTSQEREIVRRIAERRDQLIAEVA
jgi:hypothetical protein